MVFNGDGNNQDIVSDINFWCSTNNTTYTIEDKVRNANFALAKVSSMIMRFDRTWKHISDNLNIIPVATKNLTSGVTNYTLETKHIKILRVRIIDKSGKKKTLEAIDRRKLSDDVLNKTGEPQYYDKVGRSLVLHPTPDYGASGGVEIEYQSNAAEDLFTVASTDKEPGFNSDFHRLVSLYASEDYCLLHAPKRLNAIRSKIQELETALVEYFESRDIDDEPGFKVEKRTSGHHLLMN